MVPILVPVCQHAAVVAMIRSLSEASVLMSLQWRHNERDGVSNHRPHDCLPNRLFAQRSKKTSKLRVTGLCAANSLGIGEFPEQMASYAVNISIWWRHHGPERYLVATEHLWTMRTKTRSNSLMKSTLIIFIHIHFDIEILNNPHGSLA